MDCVLRLQDRTLTPSHQIPLTTTFHSKVKVQLLRSKQTSFRKRLTSVAAMGRQLTSLDVIERSCSLAWYLLLI